MWWPIIDGALGLSTPSLPRANGHNRPSVRMRLEYT